MEQKEQLRMKEHITLWFTVIPFTNRNLEITENEQMHNTADKLVISQSPLSPG